jgi:RHS repeat-associated protein
MNDVDGALVWRGDYAPFGESLEEQPINWGNPYAFLGNEDDGGLMDFNARFYDPRIGRFTSPDPILDISRSQAINPYVYCMNNPIRYADPMGLWSGGGGPEEVPETQGAAHWLEGVTITGTRPNTTNAGLENFRKWYYQRSLGSGRTRESSTGANGKLQSGAPSKGLQNRPLPYKTQKGPMLFLLDGNYKGLLDPAGQENRDWVNENGKAAADALSAATGNDVSIQIWETWTGVMADAEKARAYGLLAVQLSKFEGMCGKLGTICFIAEGGLEKEDGPNIAHIPANILFAKIKPFLKYGAEIAIFRCNCNGAEWKKIADSFGCGWVISTFSTPDSAAVYYLETQESGYTRLLRTWIDRNIFR